MTVRECDRRIARHVRRAHVAGLVSGAALALTLATPAAGQDRAAPGPFEMDGRSFSSWQELVQSDAFRESGRRCGYVSPATVSGSARAGGADCTASATDPDVAYEPDGSADYVIQVVVHIIRNAAATQGEISDQLVESQIQVLNEDFEAIKGTNGELGHLANIRFELATEDPLGSQTNGITRDDDDQWFNDNGAYYNSIAWDPTHYLNIYTMRPQGSDGVLGYVPFLPQEGPAGTPIDRVVIHWLAFGSPGLGGPPYHLGRTVTHEVGHFLGIHHPFRNGCQTGTPPGCYSSGDLLCDTPSQDAGSGSGSCMNGQSCGSDNNIDNYMDYGDDICMQRFTVEQVRRMRCTLEGYRDTLYDTVTVPTRTTSWGSLKGMFK